MSGDYMQGDKDSATVVPFSDDETEKDKVADELDEDSPSATPEERITRKQHRQARIKRLLDEGKQNAERVKTLETEHSATRLELERLRGYVAAQPQPRAGDDNAKDPYEARLDAVYEKQSEAYTAAQAEIKAGTFTEARQKHYERIAREVESEKTRIHTERAIDSRAGSQRAEQAQQVWVQKYPEVYQNPKAFQFAKATWERRRALGEQSTNDMVDEVMHETMAQFRLGPKKAPSASDRSRMSGVPSAGGSGSSRSSGIDMASNPALRRMAVAAYGDLPEAEAVKKWVNGPGKRLREKKVL